MPPLQEAKKQKLWLYFKRKVVFVCHFAFSQASPKNKHAFLESGTRLKLIEETKHMATY